MTQPSQPRAHAAGDLFVTTEAEAAELEQPPTPAELADLHAKWRARVKGPAGELLDAGGTDNLGDGRP